MGKSKDRQSKAAMADDFNRLAGEQDFSDAVERIGAIRETITGLMLFDLLQYMEERINEQLSTVSAMHAKVLLAIEQVEEPNIPYLVLRPEKLLVLTGMLSSLNTDIMLARTSTCPDALRRHEIGYPQEMGVIAAQIDEALGISRQAQRRPRTRGGFTPSMG